MNGKVAPIPDLPVPHPGGSDPDSGFDNDVFTAGEAVRWLRVNANEARKNGKPFFMVASFVNPHDIMFGNGNVPDQPEVQKPGVPALVPPPPASSTYEKKWSFKLPASLGESLTAPGMPKALLEYKNGWDAWSGSIPTDRKDMWTIFDNFYRRAWCGKSARHVLWEPEAGDRLR
jgi:hypothetical protein